VARNVSLIPSAQTGYGAQSAFRSLGTRGSFRKSSKRSEVSSPFPVEIKNEWSSTSTPTYADIECTCTTLSLPRYLNTLTDGMSSNRPSKIALSIWWLAWLPQYGAVAEWRPATKTYKIHTFNDLRFSACWWRLQSCGILHIIVRKRVTDCCPPSRVEEDSPEDGGEKTATQR